MVFFTVEQDGREKMWAQCPHKYYKQYQLEEREHDFWWHASSTSIDLPKGFIEKYIGKKLTWDDLPYEIV